MAIRAMDAETKVISDDFKKMSKALSLELLHGKKILISGASGMLGSYVTKVLLLYNDTLQNHQDRIHVYALARSPQKMRNHFGRYGKRSDLEFVICDICEGTSYPKADYVIHAASLASPKYYKAQPVETLLANTTGTINLLQYSRKAKVKSFLFFSSGEVYGTPLRERQMLQEDDYGAVDPLDPRSCYAEGKRAGEALCVAWWNQYGIPVKIVRPFHVYGPGMALDDGRVFADFIDDVLHGRDIVIRGDGKAERPFCYLSDAALAFFKVLLLGENGSAYNVGNPEANISISALAELLVEMNKELGIRIKFDNVRNGYLKSKVIKQIPPSVERLKTLGWEATISIEEGFMNTIRSFRDEVD
jgi:Nucleoside-diphosphate-sugar epimerases